MSAGKLTFGDSKLAHVDSAEDLVAELVQIRRRFAVENPIIGMVHTNNIELTLGISPKGCYVNYINSSSLPPYYSSVGDRMLSSKDGIVHYQMSPVGHESEISIRNAISFEDLLRVAKSFLNTGERPQTEIEWEIY